MVNYKSREIESSLLSKGFRRTKMKHHLGFVYYTFEGLKTPIFTRLSHGNHDINDWLQKMMSQQLGVTRQEFVDLVECPLDQSGYEERVQGIIQGTTDE